VTARLGWQVDPEHRDSAVLVQAWVDFLNGGSEEAMRRAHAVDFVDHDPHPSFAGTIDGVINSTEMLRRDGLAVQFGLVDLFAVGDRIAYRVGAKGTQRNGAGISVEIFTLANTGIFRVEDGVLAERWGAWSYTQLGQS
jgi:hypothetical protein